MVGLPAACFAAACGDASAKRSSGQENSRQAVAVACLVQGESYERQHWDDRRKGGGRNALARSVSTSQRRSTAHAGQEVRMGNLSILEWLPGLMFGLLTQNHTSPDDLQRKAFQRPFASG